MRKLDFKLAANILLGIMALFELLHVLIIVGIVPSSIVWGGRMDASGSSVVLLEGIAFVVMLLFMLIIAIKAGYIKTGKILKRIVDIAVWVLFVYFLLNTVGNLTAHSFVEQWVFGPVTIIMAVLTFRLAIEK